MKILVLSAHMDDETFGLAGTLLKYIDEGHEVKVVALCKGRNEENYKQRIFDFSKTMDSMGCEKTYFGYIDTNLYQADTGVVADIIFNQTSLFNPNILFCPSINDIHQDHEFLSRATRIAIRPQRIKNLNLSEVYEYQVPGSFTLDNQDFNIAFNITNYIDKKLDLCKNYSTELKNEGDPCSITGIKTLAKFNGMSFGFDYAELANAIYIRKN